MKIGIDISQIVHEGTGVAMYVREMVTALLAVDRKNEYILFGASLRKRHIFNEFFMLLRKRHQNVKLVTVPIPPTLLEPLWNRFHTLPVEKFIGAIDVFWSSDWTQPPLRHAIGITTIHDLIALKFPGETDSRIVAAHKRRLGWVAKECHVVLCDSQATKADAVSLLNISPDRLRIVYPGVNL